MTGFYWTSEEESKACGDLSRKLEAILGGEDPKIAYAVLLTLAADLVVAFWRGGFIKQDFQSLVEEAQTMLQINMEESVKNPPDIHLVAQQ